MAKIVIDKEKCKGCLLCVSVCPKGALISLKELNKKGVLPVGVEDGIPCSGCRFCALICPDCCIEIIKE
jgi:2-oxoglutarate ferredoxin oxidoreductase subunit delta